MKEYIDTNNHEALYPKEQALLLVSLLLQKQERPHIGSSFIEGIYKDIR